MGDENRRRYCHGWKKAINYSRNLSCQQSNHLILVKNLHGNPYHAFHDTAWAVGYYIYYCLQDPKNTHIWISSSSIHKINIEHCFKFRQSTEDLSGMRPSWGVCFLSVLAINYGIDEKNIHISDFSASTYPPGFCWRKQTIFSGYYREFKYLALPRKSTESFWKFFHKYKVFKKRNDHLQKSVPWNMKRNALINMTKSISNYYVGDSKNYSFAESENQLQVLLYGRGDVRRRRWRNIDKTIHYLNMDKSINLTTIYNMPSSFSVQVKLFNKADIVITPHGAALANSVFMKKQSGILEIHKCCLSEIRNSPTNLHMWTGWHVKEFSLNIRYLQCHEPENILSINELKSLELKPEDDHGCRYKEFDVDPKEVLKNLQILRNKVQKPDGSENINWNVYALIGLLVAIILFCFKRSQPFSQS